MGERKNLGSESFRNKKREKKLSLEDPLFDISFDDFGENDEDGLNIAENSEAGMEIIKIISGKSVKDKSKSKYKNKMITGKELLETNDMANNPLLYIKDRDSKKSNFLQNSNLPSRYI